MAIRKHRAVAAAARAAYVEALRDGRKVRASTFPLERVEGTVNIFDGWDTIRPTELCRHCNGSGYAPSADHRTECGFCE